MLIHPETIEIVIYSDGTAAISYFDRGESGQTVYRGRDFLDANEIKKWRYKWRYKSGRRKESAV